MSSTGGSDDPNSPDIDAIYSIIGNPHKRRIILYLGEHGEASFSELKRALKVSVGNLYYNLDGLAGFVTKNEKRRYLLTEEGLKLYRWMRDSEPMLRAYISRRPKKIIDQYILPVLVPVEAVSIFYKQRALGAAAAMASLLAGLATIVVTGGMLFILEFFPYVSFPLPLRAAIFLAGLLVSAVLVEAGSRFMGFHAPLGIDFLGAFSSGFLPIYATPVILSYLFTDPLQRSIAYRVLQVFSLGLLTAAISVYKKMPKERAFIIVFTLYYLGFLLHLFLGGL